MKLDEIINTILAQTGQYIVAEDVSQLEELQLDRDKFWRIIRADIEDYARFKPVTKRFNIDMTTNVYKFDDAGTNGSNGAPLAISKVVPVGWLLLVTRAAWLTPLQFRTGYNYNQLNRLIDPSMFLWNYWTDWVDPDGEFTGPFLVCSQGGKVEVNASYMYTFNITRQNGKIIDIDIPELDAHLMPIFWDILAGKVMKAVGGSRRAFTYTDLPVTTDGDQLIQEGTALYEKAREGLYHRSEWWKSVTV